MISIRYRLHARREVRTRTDALCATVDREVGSRLDGLDTGWTPAALDRLAKMLDES